MSMNIFTLALANEWFNTYMERSASKLFMIGGIVKDVVMFAICEPKDLKENLTIQEGSDKENNSRTLRLTFSKDLKKKVAKTGIVLATKEEFETFAKELGGNGKMNRGKALEKLIFNYYGQDWKADNKEYTEYADIVVNGVNYQIKTDKATFLNESEL